jgi:hypothetical protein
MKEETLLLKFDFKRRDVFSVPIYELGDTLVAIQRIVHKSYLFEKDRLRKGAKLSQAERRNLSLRICEQRDGSDIYALAPFAGDPMVQQALQHTLKFGLQALSKYVMQKVLRDNGKTAPDKTSIQMKDVEGSALAGAIYAETVQITNHIYNIGNVESVQLIPNDTFNIPTIKMTSETQKYVRSIKSESFRGEFCEIVGEVTRLLPNRSVAEIRMMPSRYVKVGLSEESFRFVRYETEQEQRIKFTGFPLLRLGDENALFEEFEAVSAENVDE